MTQSTRKSQEIVARAMQVMPGGVNSPVRAFKAVGGIPRVIAHGEGAYLTDIDGNRYLDFSASWGPLILGHADPDVVSAVKQQIDRGLTFGATTEVEYELASLMVNTIPALDRLRFVSSGTEAVMSAVRLARGFTGRDLVLKFDGCYHGHCDYLLVSAGSGLATFGQPSSAGVPASFADQTAVLPLDDIEALELFFREHGDKLAAALIEGVPANNGLLIQRPEFMKRLRELTEEHGALLVLDEVITGFRIGPQGAAGYYSLTPDLVTYGKVVGGGMPVGAFGGRADIMARLSPDGPVYQAGTLSGNPVAMTAGLATLNKLLNGRIYDELEDRTASFCARLAEKLDGHHIQVVRLGSIFWLVFQSVPPLAASRIENSGIERYNRLHGSLLEAGIYLPPSGYEVCFVSSAHTAEDLNGAADAIASLIVDTPVD